MVHAKSDLRVFLKWMIARSGSAITYVIQLGQTMQNSTNPFEAPETTTGTDKPESSSATRTLYVHCVALFGGFVAFIGGFGAAFVLPTMISQTLASSRMWVTILLVFGLLAGLLCAVLSYRATLRTHAKR